MLLSVVSSRRARRPVLAALVVGALAMSLSPRPAKATLEDQRARLPPPKECGDPIEGVWQSRTFTAERRQWYDFTLEIHRKAANVLAGEIRSHFWSGTAASDLVPACIAGEQEAIVVMPGAGMLEATPTGQQVVFGATTHKIETVVCGPGTFNYRPDKFSGTIDPAAQEFQSVNNDGGWLVNEPYLFRRVRCFEEVAEAPAPAPSSQAPKAEPPRSSGGCGCGF